MDILIEGFIEKHPEHAARILESASKVDFLQIIESSKLNLENIISHISPTYMAHVFEIGESEAIIEICSELDDSLIATILRYVSESKLMIILQSFDAIKMRRIQELIHYNVNQIGYHIENVDLILSINASVQSAIESVETLKSYRYPIYVVDEKYSPCGTLDLVSLLKQRSSQNSTICQLIKKDTFAFKASTPLENVRTHPAWENNRVIPIVGRSNFFLGVVSKNIISAGFRESLPENLNKNAIDEYIYFSEVLWAGLQKFWGALK
jgi:Mg/Co/Ni transporter MgtE